MTCDEEFTPIASHYHADPTVGRLSNHRQIRIRKDILAMQFRMTAMGHHEHIIEPAEDGQRGV